MNTQQLLKTLRRGLVRIIKPLIIILLVILFLVILSPDKTSAQHGFAAGKNEFIATASNPSGAETPAPSEPDSYNTDETNPGNSGPGNNTNDNPGGAVLINEQQIPAGPFNPEEAPKTADGSDPEPYIAALAISIIFLRNSVFTRRIKERGELNMKHKHS